jgi:hypothetical protein
MESIMRFVHAVWTLMALFASIIVAPFQLRRFQLRPLGVLWDGAGSDTAVEDALLRDLYDKVIAEGVLNNFPLKDEFKVKDSPWDGGRGLKWNAHVGRNTSPMATGQDGAFAVADHQKYTEGYVTQRKIMARWRVTQEQLDDTQNSEAAYRNSRTENMTRLVDDISYRSEFYLSTDGRAIFARIDDADPDGDNTLTVDAPGGITGDDFGNRFMQRNMYIGAVNPATGDLRTGVVKLTDVSDDGTSVTAAMSGLTGWADNDYLVQVAHDSVTDVLDSAYNKAPMGLTGLIDDGTYVDNFFGVQRSKFGNYKSYVVANAASLSFDLLQRVSDIVNQKLGGSIDAIWCHHSIRRLFILLTQADRRYADSAGRRNPDGGTAAFQQEDITMGSVAVKAIRTLGLAQMFLVDRKGADFTRYTSEKGKWVETGGGILQRDGTGKNARHAYEAWWYTRYQLFARNPGKCARLDGITGQTFVAVRGE